MEDDEESYSQEKRKKKRKEKKSCGWDSSSHTSLNEYLSCGFCQFNIYFTFCITSAFDFPGFENLGSEANAFVSSLLILRTVIVVPVFM